METAEAGAVSEFSHAFADIGEGAMLDYETVVPSARQSAARSAPQSAKFALPGVVVFAGRLSAKQDGNGWWSKLALMKGYAQYGFQIAIWTQQPDGDPLGSLTHVDPLGTDPLAPTQLGKLDLYDVLPHVALVIDRYSPNYSQPEILRLVFSDDDRGCHPAIVADFADVSAWINEQEGRSFSKGNDAYYTPSVGASWRPEVLRLYDTVHLPRGPAAERVRKVLEATP